MVGKILGKRYVLLEEIEAVEAPAATRFLAYDMNSLSRIKVLVHRDDSGELDPERFDLEQAEARAGSRSKADKAKPTKKVPPKKQTPSPGPTPQGSKTLPLPMLGKSPATDNEARTIPFPSPAKEAEKKPARQETRTTPPKSSPTEAKTVPMKSPAQAQEPDGKTTPMPRPPQAQEQDGKTIPIQRPAEPAAAAASQVEEEKALAPPVKPAPAETEAPSLGDALNRAFGMDAEPPVPADSTQPLRLAEMEELEQLQGEDPTPEPALPHRNLLRVEPSRPMPGGKGRPETRRIEAAWFAMGDEMGDEEDADPPPPEAPSDLDAAQLWQQASSLSRDEYQRFALDLPPPAPPPAPAPAPAPPEGNPDKAVAGEIVAPATTPEPPRVPRREEPPKAEGRDRAHPPARPRLQIIEPSTPPSPSRSSDSTSYIKQEMGVISPVERVKQNRFFRWSIDTRAGTFVLGAILGILLTLLVSC